MIWQFPSISLVLGVEVISPSSVTIGLGLKLLMLWLIVNVLNLLNFLDKGINTSFVVHQIEHYLFTLRWRLLIVLIEILS